jgi:Apea-like HEPN
MISEISDQELFAAFSNALREGLATARKAFTDKAYVTRKRDWPQLSGLLGCGMPSFTFSSGYFDGPVDYAHFLKHENLKEVAFRWLREFIDFCSSRERIRSYYTHPVDGSGTEDQIFFEVRILVLLSQMIDSYIHSFGQEYKADNAEELYLKWETLLYADTLNLEVVVPLLFLHCEVDDFDLAQDARLVKLTEKQQLSRMASYDLRYSASSPQRIVTGAATHALVLRRLEIKQQSTRWKISEILGTPGAFPSHIIENFFCALRVCGSAVTGYSQIIAAPVGWATKFTGDLLPWLPVLVRRYAARFETGYWVNENISRLTSNAAENVREVFAGLCSLEQKQLELARTRINIAALREDEEDAVIDATIALEALLSDESPQEMTHKLALRLAALGRLTDYPKKPSEIFRGVKQVYNYRSAIVHGSAKAKSKREIALGAQESIRTVELAEEYARLALRALVKRPEFLDPMRIDRELLLGDSDCDK